MGCFLGSWKALMAFQLISMGKICLSYEKIEIRLLPWNKSNLLNFKYFGSPLLYFCSTSNNYVEHQTLFIFAVFVTVVVSHLG